MTNNCQTNSFVCDLCLYMIYINLIYLTNFKWQSKITPRFLAVDDGEIHVFNLLIEADDFLNLNEI